MKPKPIGYSGTPLAKKLGILKGARVLVVDAPADYSHLLAPLPEGVEFEKRLSKLTGIVHLFSLQKARMAIELKRLRELIRPDAAVWVSWPKTASKVPTDIIEERIRELALPLGFVDIKVCAVSEVWSGLKIGYPEGTALSCRPLLPDILAAGGAVLRYLVCARFYEKYSHYCDDHCSAIGHDFFHASCFLQPIFVGRVVCWDSYDDWFCHLFHSRAACGS